MHWFQIGDPLVCVSHGGVTKHLTMGNNYTCEGYADEKIIVVDDTGERFHTYQTRFERKKVED